MLRLCEWPLGAKVVCGWQLARRWGLRYYNCKEVDNFRELGIELAPVHLPDKGAAGCTLISSLVSL